jgi:hypothetical protein
MLLIYKALIRLHFNCQTIKFMQEKRETDTLTVIPTEIPYLRCFKLFDNPLSPPNFFFKNLDFFGVTDCQNTDCP